MRKYVFLVVILSVFMMKSAVAQYDRLIGERGPKSTYATASVNQVGKASEFKQEQEGLKQSVVWSFICKPSSQLKVGDEVLVVMSAGIKDEGVFISSKNQSQKSILPTSFVLGQNTKGLVLSGSLEERNPESSKVFTHPVLQTEVNVFAKSAVFMQKLKVTEANPVIDAQLIYQVMNNNMGITVKEPIKMNLQ